MAEGHYVHAKCDHGSRRVGFAFGHAAQGRNVAEGFYEAAQTMVALWSDKSIGEVAKTFLIVDEYVGVTSVVQDRIMKVAPAAYDD